MISKDAGKSFHIIQHTFMTKDFGKPGIEGNFLNVMKGFYKVLQLTYLNGERLNAFPLRLEKRQECPLLAILFDILEVIVIGRQ